jgi:hypothetical protein
MAGRGAGSQPATAEAIHPATQQLPSAQWHSTDKPGHALLRCCSCRWSKTAQPTHFAGMRSACQEGLAARMQASSLG